MQRFFQFLRFRKNRAILIDEAAERPTEAFAVDAADEQGEMDVAPSFVPGAEGAGGDVVTNAFGGAAEEGEFPIVNDAGAIRSEMRHPAVIEKAVEQQLAAVLNEMGPVNEHHARSMLKGGFDLCGAKADGFLKRISDGRRLVRGLDEDLFHLAHALARRQRIDL